MSNVFSYMTVALVISGIAAYMFGTSLELISMLYTESGMSIFGWIVMLAPLGLVLLLGAKAQKFSYTTYYYNFQFLLINRTFHKLQ